MLSWKVRVWSLNVPFKQFVTEDGLLSPAQEREQSQKHIYAH